MAVKHIYILCAYQTPLREGDSGKFCFFKAHSVPGARVFAKHIAGPLAHRSPTNSKFDAWGFTWAKFTFTFQLETTFIRKRRLNIIKQSCILFPPK